MGIDILRGAANGGDTMSRKEAILEEFYLAYLDKANALAGKAYQRATSRFVEALKEVRREYET